MSITASSLPLGALLRDNLQTGASFSIDVRMFLSVCIDLDVDEDRLTQIYHTDNNVKFYVQYYGFSDRESYTYGGAISMSLVSLYVYIYICGQFICLWLL